MMKKLLIVLLAACVVTAVVSAAIDVSDPDSIDILDAGIVRQFDAHPEKLLKEGWTAYQNKDYEKATRYYLAYVHHVKNDSGNLYNLACCYGLIGNAELAAAWLEKAVDAGWTDMEHLRQDPDFEKVRNAEIFVETIDKLEAEQKKTKRDPGKLVPVPAYSMLPLYVKEPPAFDPEKTYPLVLGLHGYGDSAEKFVSIWDARELEINFVFAAPGAPYAFSTGKQVGYSWSPRLDPETNPDAVQRAGDMAARYVLECIEHLKKTYNINRVYLMGFSQGAGMTSLIGLKNPTLFAGIAPFGGWLDTDRISVEELKAAEKLPVLIVHGRQDTVVPFEAGEKTRQTLEKHGLTVEFLAFDGAHTVPLKGLQVLMKMVDKTP